MPETLLQIGIKIGGGPTTGIEPPHSEPIIETSPKPRLLEIADLYVYATAKAHTGKGGWKDRWFGELYSIINPERFTFGANPDSKWEDA
jgi:hypothetical protein